MFAEASLKKQYRDADDRAIGRSTEWDRTWWAAGKARHDDTYLIALFTRHGYQGEDAHHAWTRGGGNGAWD